MFVSVYFQYPYELGRGIYAKARADRASKDWQLAQPLNVNDNGQYAKNFGCSPGTNISDTNPRPNPPD